MKVKAGIIGYGYMGHVHLRKAREVGVEVVSTYEVVPEKRKLAIEEGVRPYDRIEEFLADPQIDLVFICTPNHDHAKLSIMAMRAGKHVMCEKPVAMNCRELDEILEVVKEEKKIFTVHQNRRWDPDYLVTKEVMKTGAIGNFTSIRSQVCGQRGVCYGWRADPSQGGGMLFDWGVHLIDQILDLMKGHKVVSVYSRLISVLTPGVDDSVEVQMIFDNEVCARIRFDTLCLLEAPRWFVYGDRGTMRIWDFSGEKGEIARIKTDVSGFDSVFGKHGLTPNMIMEPLKPEQIESIPLPKVDADPLEYHRNLAAAIEGSEEPYVTTEQIRRAMQIVDLAFESSRQEQLIKTEI